MKKTLYIAAAVIAVMFAASCQKDDVQAAKKGMTLSANVEETKATITDNGDKWKFSWELDDVVSVTSPSTKTYSFVYDGKSFKNAEAEPAEGKWKAVYPKSYTTEGISFVHQDGTLKSAMEKYLLTGSCDSKGSATLSIPMTPTFAILKIKNNQTSPRWFAIGNKNKTIIPTSYSNGTVGTTNDPLKSSCEIGTVEAGQESYYIVPAGSYYLFYTTSNVSKINVPSGVFQKNSIEGGLKAGHIYNVTF